MSSENAKSRISDLTKLVESLSGETCIISVKKETSGKDRDVRLVVGNTAFMNAPVGMTHSPGSKAFEPDSPYTDYIPRDIGFEDLCYRAAVLRTPIHTSVHINRLDVWINIHITPLEIDDGDVCYCAYHSKPCAPSEIDITAGEAHDTSKAVLRTCIRLRGTDDFKKSINEVIADIREICGAEVCTVMEMDVETGSSSILATSIMIGSTLKRATQFVNFYDLANSWIGMIGDGDCLIIKDEKDMDYVSQVNPIWYSSLMEAGVKSVVMFPLRYNKEVLGFIWATNIDTSNVLRIQETLELTTFFISSEIAGQKMLKRLEFVGYYDMLTGVKNRNAMNNRVTEIVNKPCELQTPFGVIFVDLNGLKTVNDNQGHNAGDLLLKKAALIMQELFEGGEIYRAGGDEFVIFLQDCDKASFTKRVNKLKARSDGDGGLSFAVGGHHVDSGCDIRDAMRIADENMYKDKDLYYEKHPKRV